MPFNLEVMRASRSTFSITQTVSSPQELANLEQSINEGVFTCKFRMTDGRVEFVFCGENGTELAVRVTVVTEDGFDGLSSLFRNAFGLLEWRGFYTRIVVPPAGAEPHQYADIYSAAMRKELAQRGTRLEHVQNVKFAGYPAMVHALVFSRPLTRRERRARRNKCIDISLLARS